MTAKKASSKKSSPKKARAKKKAAPKKKASAKPKAAAQKTTATQGGAAAKRATAPKKTAAPKRADAQKKAARPAAPTRQAAPEPKAEASAPKKSGVSSMDVVMGHVFALRPRVLTSFKPDDFRRARQTLESESYDDIAQAARAVADKALEFTRDIAPGRRRGR